jgi:DnaJ-domain-containing protein 1
VEVHLPRAAAGNLGHFAEHPFDRVQRQMRLSAGAVDQAGREALRVVEQDLEQMFC